LLYIIGVILVDVL